MACEQLLRKGIAEENKAAWHEGPRLAEVGAEKKTKAWVL